ncbi:MAG: serine--tRNA ligase, partial [Bacteroidaceae bacterium]
MLTLNQITNDRETVIKGLEKKPFKNAREIVENVAQLNDKRKTTQTKLDENLAKQNKIAKSIGLLMREGKRDEAESAKAEVAKLKGESTALQQTKKSVEDEIQQMLYTIPNVPYDEVPEGTGADDNVVVKQAGPLVDLGSEALPHWELAKKYNLIDLDLGVKITGTGFPVYIGWGARLQRALINFFLDEARESGYTEIMPPTVVNQASGYGTGQLPDKEGQMYHCEVDDLYL